MSLYIWPLVKKGVLFSSFGKLQASLRTHCQCWLSPRASSRRCHSYRHSPHRYSFLMASHTITGLNLQTLMLAPHSPCITTVFFTHSGLGSIWAHTLMMEIRGLRGFDRVQV